jgi:hypothetical protein
MTDEEFAQIKALVNDWSFSRPLTRMQAISLVEEIDRLHWIEQRYYNEIGHERFVQAHAYTGWSLPEWAKK